MLSYKRLEYYIPVVFEQTLSPTHNGFVPLSSIAKNPGLKGHFYIKFNKNFTQAKYTLSVSFQPTMRPGNKDNKIIFVHIHHGYAYENGGLIVELFPNKDYTPEDNQKNGFYLSGKITNETIIQITKDINTIASMYNAILENKLYVDVHTIEFPLGAIRGQVFNV
jgi:hypothetical protein